MFKLYNTLTNQVEEFQPLNDNTVRMYICGPTVYDFAHIGNFRTFLFGDLLRRYLKYKGYQVHHVMNITDVDDKIIQRAVALHMSLRDYTDQFTDLFFQDFDALGAERPEEVLRATDHINEMIEIIQRLKANGHAYESEGSTYFRINSFKTYGQLSNMNFEGNVAGASERMDADEYDKESVRDFVLWKAAKEGEPSWDTPLGIGRPGWHIECSAMAMKALGETFDIHAGGIDLVFPHHENEIAQSEGATGKPFVKYWVHSEFLLAEGQKMSKKLGNFYVVRDLIEQGHTPRAIRYLLLSAQHLKQFNFTMDGLRGAETVVARLNDFKVRLSELNPEAGETATIGELIWRTKKDFEASLDDDLNVSAALGALHDFVRETNSAIAAATIKASDQKALLELVDRIDSVFGIFGTIGFTIPKSSQNFIDGKIAERNAARKARNFFLSDQIRNELNDVYGIELKDTKEGPTWQARSWIRIHMDDKGGQFPSRANFNKSTGRYDISCAPPSGDLLEKLVNIEDGAKREATKKMQEVFPHDCTANRCDSWKAWPD